MSEREKSSKKSKAYRKSKMKIALSQAIYHSVRATLISHLDEFHVYSVENQSFDSVEDKISWHSDCANESMWYFVEKIIEEAEQG